MKINIIGDIAGRYDELMLLLAKMPEADLILSVGDIADRGPKSRQVIEWFMEQQKLGKAEVIYGNHEDMFINSIVTGHISDWIRNGGVATALSYIDDCKDCNTVEELYDVCKVKDYKFASELLKDMRVPSDTVSWLKKRPMYFQTDEIFVSHAPVTSLEYIPSDPYGRDHYFIWNRTNPSKPQSKFMIHGHQGTLREHVHIDGSIFGICIDDSHQNVLTGLHWPTKEIFQQDFLDKKSNLE